jgi:light-independent protochlorophyllide reductase subunit N
MIFAEPRFATAIIDERDLAGLADANDRARPRGARAAGAPARDQAAVPGGLVPVGGDQARPVARGRSACRPVHLPQRARAHYSGSGIETTFTQGEDACLAALGAGACRRCPATAPPRCWWWARWPTWSKTSSAPVRRRSAWARCSSSRRASAATLPAIGPNTRYLLAQPFLADTARALEARGASAWRRRSRWAWRAPTAWLQAAADRIRHQRRTAVEAGHGPPGACQAALARHRQQLAGKRIFFFPDSQLEMPLARFLARELGMRCSRSARPTCTASTWRPNWRCCHRHGGAVSEGQDVDRQLDRCRAAAPTSWSAAWAWPTRWRPRA